MPDVPDTQQVAIIQDHAFEPRTKASCLTVSGERQAFSFPPNPWLCQRCDLAEAAHIR
jgi:hypothetical protein